MPERCWSGLWWSRVSRADAELQQAVLQFHQGDEPPQVSHHIAL